MERRLEQAEAAAGTIGTRAVAAAGVAVAAAAEPDTADIDGADWHYGCGTVKVCLKWIRWIG